MTDSIYERGLVSCVEEEEDRISKLPQHLIDSILELLPFKDVVRTSIISKNWRYKYWTTMRELVFDEHFSKKFAKKGEFDRNEFIRIIDQILNLHSCSISKFHLHIPDMVLGSFEEVDKWMLLLSRDGVRELIIINSNRQYEVSSHVFSCLNLTKLTLNNCFVKLPLMFEAGFPNLEYLRLTIIDFGANLGGKEINLPQLKELSLQYCTHVYNFNIKATKLQSLALSSAHPDAMLLRLLDNPSINNLYIFIQEPINGLVHADRLNLASMLNNLPRVQLLSINCEFLKCVIEEKIPQWLPLADSSLKYLHLVHIQLGDLCQLHGVLCLLRNLPNLEHLQITFSSWKYPPVVDVEPALNHLEAPNCFEYTLNQLQTVFIAYPEGSRPELLFIKLLLAHSPSLKNLVSHCDLLKKELTLVRMLWSFPEPHQTPDSLLSKNVIFTMTFQFNFILSPVQALGYLSFLLIPLICFPWVTSFIEVLSTIVILATSLLVQNPILDFDLENK